MTITITTEEWDQTLLGYGLAMKKQIELEALMRESQTVEEEQRFYRLWEDQCEQVLTLRGRLAIMVKHAALQKASLE